jgi:predicted phosphodiesterase
MSHPKQVGKLAKALLDEYPTAGSLTLAKRLHQQFPEHFETVEDARNKIRYYRGSFGDNGRRKLSDLSHVTDMDSVLRAKFNLPEPAVMSREPYFIPKVNDKILIFGDCHFPYQNNEGIYKAIEYGIHKQVNCIILNGDMIDMYQISRFTKDGRKPNVEYDIEVFYQFLLDLRATFPNALIIWKFGNHEERWDTYLRQNAPLLNMIGTHGIEDHIPLNEMNILLVRDKRRIIAGDLNILHGHEFNGGAGNVNPARSMFLKAKVNILVNHFHRVSSHIENNLNGEQTRCYSLGAMCAVQDYSPYGNQNCSFGFLSVIKGICYVQNREINTM